MKDLMREMFFGFVAIAMLIELIGADIFCLLFAIDRVAELLNISEEIARRHMLSLMFWNACAASGACLVFNAIKYPERGRNRQIGFVLMINGLLGYGFYQIWFAGSFLGDGGLYIQGIACIYILFGIAAAFHARDMYSLDWNPEQPVQRNPYETDCRVKSGAR